jgi:hypothetical protein
MIDPGALGTLVLGIEANRHDDERAAFATAHTARAGRRRGLGRLRLAMALRIVAARLEPVAERPAATS